MTHFGESTKDRVLSMKVGILGYLVGFALGWSFDLPLLTWLFTSLILTTLQMLISEWQLYPNNFELKRARHPQCVRLKVSCKGKSKVTHLVLGWCAKLFFIPFLAVSSGVYRWSGRIYDITTHTEERHFLLDPDDDAYFGWDNTTRFFGTLKRNLFS